MREREEGRITTVYQTAGTNIRSVCYEEGKKESGFHCDLFNAATECHQRCPRAPQECGRGLREEVGRQSNGDLETSVTWTMAGAMGWLRSLWG